ncbi:MAG: arginase family protein [Proteobacteria bacterium]|nr:arginase family protein [Pseudomonadota bacterium]
MPARSPSRRIPHLMGTSPAKSAKGAQLAVFGAPHGTPYKGIDHRVHAAAPDAFRKALKEDGEWLDHWDFDFNGRLLPDKGFKAVDLGNLPTKANDGRGNRKKIEAMTKSIVEAGAVPMMFGGDDSVPIPFLAGFAGGPPITIVQIDAHIDWRDDRYGERMSFSSTMRRASEMSHVWRIVQAGQRGLGSARQGEVETAIGWGARLISGKTIHREGIASVLQHIEVDSLCVICLDLDVLDCTAMPAVAYPSPGGLTYVQLTELISGIAAKARIGGFAMVEFVPKKDTNGIAAFTAGRIAMHVLAHVGRQNR